MRKVAAALALLWCGLTAFAAEPEKKEPAKEAGKQAVLTVLDAGGKEHKLKTWKFSRGTRRLAWAAGKEEKGEKGKPPAGPEVLEIREENSTTYRDGILTLVPIDRIRAIDFDYEKGTVKVHVVTGDKEEDDLVLTGSTEYDGINKVTIESDIDKGELGVATVKFQGGMAKGIRGLRFASPKAPAAAPAGRKAEVTGADKNKTKHEAAGLRALYELADRSQKLSPTLMFKKTLKVDLDKVEAIKVSDPAGGEWDVTLGGETNTLTLLRKATLDGKALTLLGLVGQTKAGYKLFAVPTIVAVEFAKKQKEGDAVR
jgi:hypothetical protein